MLEKNYDENDVQSTSSGDSLLLKKRRAQIKHEERRDSASRSANEKVMSRRETDPFRSDVELTLSHRVWLREKSLRSLDEHKKSTVEKAHLFIGGVATEKGVSIVIPNLAECREKG